MKRRKTSRECVFEINKKRNLQLLRVGGIILVLILHNISILFTMMMMMMMIDEEYTIAITPVLPTEEPDNSLSMGDENLSTIPETESDGLIKSSVENFFPYTNDDESFSDEDVPKEIYSNPLFDKEIISTKIDPHHFNAEYDLIEFMLNQDTSIISSPKIDSLLEEFFGELAHIDLIPLGINEADFDT
ncbi:hypothetical protein Tco_0765817 [Tanacetum coccineum]